MFSRTVLFYLVALLSIASALPSPVGLESAKDIIKRNQVKRQQLEPRTLCLLFPDLAECQTNCRRTIFGGSTGNCPPTTNPNPVPDPQNSMTPPTTCSQTCTDPQYQCNVHGNCVKRCDAEHSIFDLFDKRCKCQSGFSLSSSSSGLTKRTFCIPTKDLCGLFQERTLSGICRCISSYELFNGSCLPKCSSGSLRTSKNSGCVDLCHKLSEPGYKQCATGGCELIRGAFCHISSTPCAAGLSCKLGRCTA